MSRVQEILEKQRRRDTNGGSKTEVAESRFYHLWTASDLEELHNRYIDFRWSNGMRTAFDYPDRKFITYVPEESSIYLKFHDVIVSIKGKGLSPALYNLLLERKISWLREADTADEESAKEEVFVESIGIRVEGEESPDPQETPEKKGA